jgi:protein-tyrosine-phosphatase
MSLKVVFVCEHGAAKSVVAAAWLRQLAREGGLDLDVVARATDPESALAQPAVDGLRGDGLQSEERAPVRLEADDLAAAWRIVGFAPEVTLSDLPGAPAELWTVPPVSEGYDAARDAIVRQLRGLLDEAGTALVREKR